MTNSALFLEAYVNTEHRLCGLKLKPLSLFHFLWLEHFKSPLLSLDRKVTLQDLELAAVICSAQETKSLLRNLEKRKLLWHWRNKLRDVESEGRAWLGYFNDYFAIPDFWNSKTETVDSTLPWLVLCAGAVVKETGWSLETVMTLPVGVVIWLNLSFSFLATGESKIMSDADKLAMSLSDKGL